MAPTFTLALFLDEAGTELDLRADRSDIASTPFNGGTIYCQVDEPFYGSTTSEVYLDGSPVEPVVTDAESLTLSGLADGEHTLSWTIHHASGDASILAVWTVDPGVSEWAPGASDTGGGGSGGDSGGGSGDPGDPGNPVDATPMQSDSFHGRRMWLRLPDTDVNNGGPDGYIDWYDFEGFRYMAGITGAGLPPVNFVSEAGPGIDGSYLRTITINEREIFVPIYMAASRPSLLRAKKRAFLRAINPLNARPSNWSESRHWGIEYVFETDQTGQRFFRCDYVEGLEGVEGGNTDGIVWCTFGLKLRAVDPWAYDLNESSVTFERTSEEPQGTAIPDGDPGFVYEDNTFVGPNTGDIFGPFETSAGMFALPEQTGYIENGVYYRKFPFVEKDESDAPVIVDGFTQYVLAYVRQDTGYQSADSYDPTGAAPDYGLSMDGGTDTNNDYVVDNGETDSIVQIGVDGATIDPLDGGVKVWPRYEITGPASYVRIHMLNGTDFRTQVPVPAGEVLVVNTNPRNRYVSLQVGGVGALGILREGGRFYQLNPNGDEMNVTAEGADADTSVAMYYRTGYESGW